MLPIALDAMGGDKAPEEIVSGAHRAVAELEDQAVDEHVHLLEEERGGRAQGPVGAAPVR